MIAAIYARKSNEQDAAADQKSVAKQRDQAGAFITKQGWTLGPECTFEDDGISGAEFLKRPGLARLLNALKPRPRFDVLVVRDTDRFGREMIETNSVLKQITDAGVVIVEYASGKEVKLDSAMDKVMVSLKGFAAEMEREQGSVRAIDSGVRKFLRGEATGPACYGYRSVNVLRDGSRTLEPVAAELRSHVVHEIDPDEAEIVRRIFQWTVQGLGWKRIARSLNVDGTKSATRLKWDGAMIRHILNREVYRGQTFYGTMKRGHKGGTAKSTKRAKPLASLVREDLRIVSEELWQAAQSARQSREAKQLRDAGGKLAGHPSLSRWLLTKFSRCGQCGASLYVKEGPKRKDGTRSSAYYCLAARSGRCVNTLGLDREATDRDVLRLFENEVLAYDTVDKTLDAEVADAGNIAAERERVQAELHGVQAEIDRLVTALAAGVAVDSITAGLKERESAKQALNARLEHLDGRARAAQVDRQALRATLGDWKKKLSGNPVVARQVLSRLLTERIAFHPDGDGGGSFEARCSYATFLVLKNAFTATGRVPEGFTEAHGRCIIPRGKTGTSGEP